MIKNKDLLVVLIRLFLGYIFFSAGMCKLTNGNFGQIIGPPWLEEALAKHGLGFFAQVVATFQVIIGALLMSQRYSLLGAIMLVPMNVAILTVTVSMNWTGTPYINAFFLGLNLVLLFVERQKFMFLFNPIADHLIKPTLTDKLGQNKYSWLGLGFCALILVAASYNLLLTNLLALLIFVCLALTVLYKRAFSLIDRILIGLPFVAMTIVTFANLSSFAVALHLIVLSTEAILLVVRIYLSSRSKKAEETGMLAGNT
ncbi:putative membrane protein YphA (DoxX/SURF4 family) [Pontibacter aydingkolensis]|uniref:DoxX family membrane protein n=1 Tax=Pontibacter aydingkolensis TaxID=1911536 RepID=A0ABS7CY05_9BACT|nr:DoxX family membrane protein [Pontibacter aydingkolensis]MBW7468685.1 DoxX family membrane protein [Pontibacter aydingkolensis]